MTLGNTDGAALATGDEKMQNNLIGQIYWDGYGLTPANSGIRRYAAQFAEGLASSGITPRIISPEGSSPAIANTTVLSTPSSHLPHFIANSKIFWPRRAQTRLVQELLQRQRLTDPVILHGLSNINLSSLSPRQVPKLRKVITIHDLIPLLAPKTVSYAYYRQFKYLLPKVLAAADKVVCVSNWTANGIRQLFPEFSLKTLVIPNGFADFDKKQTFSMPDINSSSKITLTTVSRYEGYKGFDLLKQILSKCGHKLNLILVTDTRGRQWAEREAGGLIREGTLTVLSNLPDEELRNIYRQAHAMVHPSLFEGFCLPAAECLASGTPVVYQTGSGIDETVGTAVGVPIRRHAPLSEWIEGIEYAASLKYQQRFLTNLAEHLDAAPKWPTVAKQLADLYSDLLAK